jgi:AraC-like DNA-binding protein
MRLDFATRQLATKNWTISQIAESAGFKDSFHFSHAFKTQFCISPRKYREQVSAELL